MTHQDTRTIWARGLTKNDHGKPVMLKSFDDEEPVFLKSVEHMDGGTYATVILTIRVPHDSEVVVYD